MRYSGALLLIVAALFAAGCGSRPKDRGAHAKAAEPAEAAPPTPDTTPVAALRTPAGLVLKTNEVPSAVAAPSPSPSPAAEPGQPGS